MTRKPLAIVASAFLVTAAMAQDSLEDRLRACADETDDAARLECFDKAAQPPAPPAQPAQPAPEAAPEPPAAPVVEEVAPTAAPEPEAAPQPPVATAAAPAAAPAPEAAPDPVSDFGKDIEEKEKDELKEISAMVVEVSKRSRGQYVVTLDNGQVWTEKDAEPYLRIKVGDTIKIKRIRMGGYRLVGRGNRATMVVRID